MKGRVRALGLWQGRAAAALIENGRLEDVLLDPPPGQPRIGAVYRARVSRRVERLGGQFLELAPGLSGFLRGQAPGDPALVQVAGFAEPGKAVPLSAAVALRGRYVVLTPNQPGINLSKKIADLGRREALRALLQAALPELRGAILRSSCAEAGVTDAQIVDEAQALWRRAAPLMGPDLGLRLDGPDPAAQAETDWPDAQEVPFEAFEVTDLIAAARRPSVPLKGGGGAVIEPTTALVAIDVNTGGDSSPAAGLKANLALAQDLPRQLRCRGLGGQIVIDAAPMPKRDRPRVEKALQQSFRAGPVDADLVGWTGLGHFELKVARRRVP